MMPVRMNLTIEEDFMFKEGLGVASVKCIVLTKRVSIDFFVEKNDCGFQRPEIGF